MDNVIRTKSDVDRLIGSVADVVVRAGDDTRLDLGHRFNSVQVYSGGVRVAGNTCVRAYGKADIDAYGHCSVYLSEKSRACVNGHCYVEAYDESSVFADGFAVVCLKGNSKARVRDHVNCDAFYNSQVIAEGTATVSLLNSATGEFHNDSQGFMAGGKAGFFDRSHVFATGGNVFLYDFAHGDVSGRAVVKACDCSTVKADNGARVDAGSHVGVDVVPNASVDVRGGHVVGIETVDDWLSFHNIKCDGDGLAKVFTTEENCTEVYDRRLDDSYIQILIKPNDFEVSGQCSLRCRTDIDDATELIYD